MAITNGYLTLAEAKTYLQIDDTEDDTALELSVEAASRAIDEWCGRRFYQSDGETRYFDADAYDLLWVDDLRTVTTLKTDPGGDGTYELTWSSSDYRLQPHNAATDSEPYTQVARAHNGSYSFPVGVPKSIEVVGDWGWPAVPDAIKHACSIQTAVFFKRATEGGAPIVTMDGTTIGASRFLDRTVELLLTPYRRAGRGHGLVVL